MQEAASRNTKKLKTLSSYTTYKSAYIPASDLKCCRLK